MVVAALLIVTLVFALLLVARVGAARRTLVLRHWAALALGAVAVLMAARGAWQPALVFALGAFGAWWLRQPRTRANTSQPRPDDAQDAAARALLGVGPQASASEIRAAFRAKMASAHPDKGGSHDRAARLVAARDRLLKER